MYIITILLLIAVIVLSIWLYKFGQKFNSFDKQKKEVLGSDQRFRLLLQNIPNVSVQGYDCHRRVNFWNEASEKLYGYSHKEAVGKLIEDLIIPESMKEIVVKSTDDWLSGGAAIPAGELELKTKSGQLVYVYSSHVMSHDNHGNPEMYCIDIDLTVHKQDQIALQKSEAKSRAIIEASPIPFVLHNAPKEVVFVNKAFTRQYGYTLEDIPTYKEWGETVYPDEEYAKKIQKIWQQRFETAIKTGQQFKPLEIDIKCKNGDMRTVIASATPIAEGFEEEILVSLYDITERKQQERTLLLAATVFQFSSEGMMSTNADRNVIAINPAFTRITGYSEEDVLGRPALMLMSDKQDPSFYDELKTKLDREGEWQGEIWKRRKDGSDFLAWLTINTIYDDGSVRERVTLFSDITEKKEAETVALQKANYDDLTALPNRNMFNDRLEQEIKKSNRSNKELALFFLDLDKFKEVNDTFGHQVGDRLLVDAAKRITDCVRDADTVARLGGDEFTIILTDLDDVLGVERIANNIIESLSQPFQLGTDIAYVSASIGITLYPNDAHDVDGLLKNADQAMYMAKDAGRGCFRYFTKKMQQSAWERFNLLNDLRVALAKDQLELYYQPIIHLPTSKIHKAEALLRWNHPEKGLVSPAEFIPLAEESGLIIDIGRWVFLQAFKQIKACQKLDPEFQISINKSPIQFREKSDVLSVMKQYEVAGNNVVIEITESLLMENKDLVAEKLLRYRDAGVQVAIDDFGSGYSSLAYLNKFDIDYLKIDQSFVQNLMPNSSEMALSEAMIVMAHKLGLEVVAEGVETEQQRDLLLTADCDYVQGYLYSKPLPKVEFEQFLMNSAVTLN